jgi:hypothetical protein
MYFTNVNLQNEQFYFTLSAITKFSYFGPNVHQVTTCYGGRNRKVAEAFVLQKKSIEQLEAEMLNGQKLQVCQFREMGWYKSARLGKQINRQTDS